jgi:hypothetical protein
MPPTLFLRPTQGVFPGPIKDELNGIIRANGGIWMVVLCPRDPTTSGWKTFGQSRRTVPCASGRVWCRDALDRQGALSRRSGAVSKAVGGVGKRIPSGVAASKHGMKAYTISQTQHSWPDLMNTGGIRCPH